MSWTENSGTKIVLWRIRLPKTMVPENLAMTEFWLGNFIEIGLRFWNKDLKGQIWSVAPLSKIQEKKEKTKPVGLVVHWWTTVAVEEESLRLLNQGEESFILLSRETKLSFSFVILPGTRIDSRGDGINHTILAWAEGLEGGGWTLVCRLESWGTPCLIQQESDVWLVRWQWSQYLGLRPPDRGKRPRPWLLEKPLWKFLTCPSWKARLV